MNCSVVVCVPLNPDNMICLPSAGLPLSQDGGSNLNPHWVKILCLLGCIQLFVAGLLKLTFDK